MIARIDKEPNFLDNGGNPSRNMLLAPGGEYTYALTTDIPWDSISDNKIKYGPFTALVHGCITYYDIFDCVHWTNYCFALDPKRGEWHVYEKHNEADNDKCAEAITK